MIFKIIQQVGVGNYHQYMEEMEDRKYDIKQWCQCVLDLISRLLGMLSMFFPIYTGMCFCAASHCKYRNDRSFVFLYKMTSFIDFYLLQRFGYRGTNNRYELWSPLWFPRKGGSHSNFDQLKLYTFLHVKDDTIVPSSLCPSTWHLHWEKS